MDFELSVGGVSVKGNRYGGGQITVAISGADIEDILSEIKIADIISHYSKESLLDAIGEEEVKGYFDLYSKEDIENFDGEFTDV